jgi:hypothetical protein
MQGTTAGFKSRAPQYDKVQQFRRIVMCDDAPWDPTKIKFLIGIPHMNTNAIFKIKVPIE